MPLGSDRSPHQTFGRAAELASGYQLPKGEVRRPSYERQPYGGRERGGASGGELHPDGPGPLPADFMGADDIEGLPWRRERYDAWSTAAFRAEVLAFIRRYVRSRRSDVLRIVAWAIEEKATQPRTGPRRLTPDKHFLRFTITRRVSEDATAEVELSVPFPPSSRDQPALRLDVVERNLDALLGIV